MSRNKIAILILSSFWAAGTGYASDVYITQAGSNTTIDITQTGSGNTVGTSSTASTFNGASDIDISQIGSGNTANVSTSVGTSGTILNYSATGGTNVLDVQIDGATDTTLTTAITGDSNEVTLCGTLSTNAGTATSAACSTGVQVNTTTTNVAITGDSNKVAVGADAASAVNNITIGGNHSSSSNIVNLQQSGSDIPAATLSIDGSSNEVNIIQN
jgi:hypothetical protein